MGLLRNLGHSIKVDFVIGFMGLGFKGNLVGGKQILRGDFPAPRRDRQGIARHVPSCPAALHLD
jgi:hypothetical protein